MCTPSLLRLRFVLMMGVAVNLCLVIVRVWSYRPLLAMPGALRLVTETTVALLGCALFIALATSDRGIERQRGLWAATKWGTISGALLMTHMALENFGNRVGERGWITLTFMMTTFLLWVIVGFKTSENSIGNGLPLLAGCWSAVVGVLLALTFGFSLMFYDVSASGYVATWEEFKRSGWSDARAFAIANSLEAGFTHLLTGLVLGALCGGIGSLAARARRTFNPTP